MKFTIRTVTTNAMSHIKPLPQAQRETIPWKGWDNKTHLQEFWTIEVESLEQLMALVGEEGDVIVKPVAKDTKLPEIEIYSGYRE